MDFLLLSEGDYLPEKYAVYQPACPLSTCPLIGFTSELVNYTPEPFSEADVQGLLAQLSHRLHLTKECLVAAAAYVVRTSAMGVKLRQESWRPLLIASAVLSLKMWRDLPYLNSAVSNAIGLYTLHSINRMEVLLARYLEWKLFIDVEEYESIMQRIEAC